MPHRSQEADLTLCDKEPIHIPGMIQPFGAMLAMRLDTLEILQASENLEQVLGVQARSILGRHLCEVIGEVPYRMLSNALGRGELHSVSPTILRLPGSGCSCYMYYNSTGDTLIAEFELVQDAAELLQQSSAKGELPFRAINECATYEQLCSLLAREMRRLTDFDRTIVYRFDEDWHGVVIAEEKNHVYEHSFLGHHFPASDIPVQARKLFTLNHFRVIPDVGYTPVPLVPSLHPISKAPLDMTFCTLRNVAPVHLEYLGNMNVKASMTVSLMNGERLWGMITCHHSMPRNMPIDVRMHCKVLAEIASYAIANIERHAYMEQQDARQKELRKVQEVLASSTSFGEALHASATYMLKALDVDAIVLRLGTQVLELGTAVPQGVIESVRAGLERSLRGDVAHSRRLGALDPRLVSAASMASGGLYCRLNDAGDYLIALRREIVESRKWAGNPHKPVELPATGRLHPRKSFELWQEAVRGFSKRWQAADVDAALELKRLLLERIEQLARREFEGALRVERDRSTGILEAMGEGFMLLDHEFRIVRINSEGARMAGRPVADILNHRLGEVWPDAGDSFSSDLFQHAMADGARVSIEKQIVNKNGNRFWLDVRMYPSADGLAVFYRDISERKAMEEALRQMNDTLEDRVSARTQELERAHDQLRQSQKMEAMGQLTGGIAHDFNNLLASIVSSLEMMQFRLQQGRADELGRYVSTASNAAERAAALTRRLLSFARQQTLAAAALDANRLIAGIKDLVQRAVGPSVDIELHLADDVWPVFCDPHQLENALLNLAINGRDAMPDGGQLRIATRNMTVSSPEEAKALDLEPGDYVTVSVSDSGTGMPPDVIERAFDPFFTTKPVGKGTGLGLSMIYGFTKQSGGQTRILSKPGEGTTVYLYLPRFTGNVDEKQADDVDIGALKPRQEASVLVVEDEPDLRALLVDMLQELGYRVSDAPDAEAALAVMQSGTSMHLLVSDVGLPGRMNGRKLVEHALQRYPQLKALLITGYGDQAPKLTYDVPDAVAVLSKPFTMEAFAARVLELLEQGQGTHQRYRD